MTSLTLFSTNDLGYSLSFRTSSGDFNTNNVLSFPVATDTAVYESFPQSISNKTFTNTTITDDSNTVTAKKLGTSLGTGFDVTINGSAPSGPNKVLLSTSSTNAVWDSIPNSAIANSSITINTTGPGFTGGGTVPLGGTLNLSKSLVFQVSSLEIKVSNTSEMPVSHMPWRFNSWIGSSVRSVYSWIVPGTGNRNLILRARDDNSSILGSLTVNSGSPSGMYTFTISSPVSDTKISFTVQSSGNVGTCPSIYGIIFEVS